MPFFISSVSNVSGNGSFGSKGFVLILEVEGACNFNGYSYISDQGSDIVCFITH